MLEPFSSHRARTIAMIVALTAGLAAPLRAQVMPEGPPSPSPSPSPSAAPTEHGPKEPIVVRDHRTIRSYPANLGHNVVEVWRKESLLPLLIGSGATGLSFLGDASTVRYFDRHPMKNYGNVGKFVGTGVVAAAASTAVFGLGHYANGDRFKAAAYDMSQAVVVNFLYTLVIKESIRRDRPDHSDHLAFPSGHASNAFACATVWSEQYGWKAAVPGYLAAGLVAGSRLALKKHRLSDIVGGATLGVIVGQSVARWDKKPSHKPLPGELKVWLGPASAPDGSGLGIGINVLF
ncbi:MAG TPA: phosphatase PAP2 family protein [Vicinamibacteria bacterium]|nr:phosphatase PAP2 family protein [Vicinamibacteria bacterium]